MENGETGNMFKKQDNGMCKTKAGKPPTRLQKHASASLKLDQMKAPAARSGPFGSSNGTSEAATPIPLLTTLALSPTFSKIEEFVFPTDDKRAATPAPTPTALGRKYPAGSGYAEASPSFALLQNKCFLVNDAR